MTFYCPKCWREIPECTDSCPFCGYDLIAHVALSYEHKLITALAHRIRENRLLAIQALGDLSSRSALSEFARILRDEEDYYALRETLIALAKINTAESRSLILDATRNRSRLVRDFAKEIMSKEPVV